MAGLKKRINAAILVVGLFSMTGHVTGQTVLYSGGEWDFENGFYFTNHYLNGQCSDPPAGQHQSCVNLGPGSEEIANGWTHWAAFPDWPTFGHYGQAEFNRNQFQPNVARGISSQEITLTCGNGAGVMLKQATVPVGHRLRFEADAKYTWNMPPGGLPAEVSLGLDPTGGTNPAAPSVIWTLWDGRAANQFQHTSEEIISTGPVITMMIRFLVRHPNCDNSDTFVCDNAKVTDLGPAGPALEVFPAVLHPEAPSGSSPSNDAFTVRNPGTGVVSYEIVDDAPWLSVSPTTGSSSGESDTITISYTAESLPPGTHEATITVTSAEAGNSPQSVTVLLTLAPKPGDLDGDDDVDQADFGLFQVCYTGPGIPPSLPCLSRDLDQDNDVDQDDFGVFQACVSGPNQPADPQCSE